MNYALTAIILVLLFTLGLVVDVSENKITELEYNLSITNTQLLLYKSLPPLETSCK